MRLAGLQRKLRILPIGQQSDLLDLLEDALVLNDTHAEHLLRTPVLVQHIVGVLAELLHVGANEHLAQLHEIAVILVVDLDDTPRISTTTNFTVVCGLDKVVRANDGEGNLASDLFRLGKCFLVLILVRGCLENLDLVLRDVGEDLELLSVSSLYIRVRSDVRGP